MDEHELLAEQFETERPHLRAVAYQMLGSLSEDARLLERSGQRDAGVLAPPLSFRHKQFRQLDLAILA